VSTAFIDYARVHITPPADLGSVRAEHAAQSCPKGPWKEATTLERGDNTSVITCRISKVLDAHKQHTFFTPHELSRNQKTAKKSRLAESTSSLTMHTLIAAYYAVLLEPAHLNKQQGIEPQQLSSTNHENTRNMLC
jgi:hypothetical protein